MDPKNVTLEVSSNLITPCEYARERHRNFAMWRNLWSILLFVFGTAIVLFLISAVLFFLRSDWLPAALTTLGTICNGIAIKWVTDRRGTAVTEEEEAYKDVQQKCNDTTSADKVREESMLLRTFR